MIARLILTLLLALAALPAQATPTCHVAGMPTAGHVMPMPARHHTPLVSDHHCLGCAALADWSAARLGAPVVVPAERPSPRAVRFTLGGSAPPALPPPRIG